jgi:hypothetical protein
MEQSDKIGDELKGFKSFAGALLITARFPSAKTLHEPLDTRWSIFLFFFVVVCHLTSAISERKIAAACKYAKHKFELAWLRGKIYDRNSSASSIMYQFYSFGFCISELHAHFESHFCMHKQRQTVPRVSNGSAPHQVRKRHKFSFGSLLCSPRQRFSVRGT